MAQLKPVGQYVERFNQLTNQALPVGIIYQSDGLATHVAKRHPNEIGNLAHIPAVISSPDYIGQNPNEPDSIELVKILSNNVMVCVKLDKNRNHMYVASVFNITNAKLQSHINSGRLKRY